MSSILNDQIPNTQLGLNGRTPSRLPGANPNSTLHFKSSLSNTPAINLPPSLLDLDGNTPEQYLDNLPR